MIKEDYASLRHELDANKAENQGYRARIEKRLVNLAGNPGECAVLRQDLEAYKAENRGQTARLEQRFAKLAGKHDERELVLRKLQEHEWPEPSLLDHRTFENITRRITSLEQAVESSVTCEKKQALSISALQESMESVSCQVAMNRREGKIPDVRELESHFLQHKELRGRVKQIERLIAVSDVRRPVIAAALTRSPDAHGASDSDSGTVLHSWRVKRSNRSEKLQQPQQQQQWDVAADASSNISLTRASSTGALIDRKEPPKLVDFYSVSRCDRDSPRVRSETQLLRPSRVAFSRDVAA
jgi:hypothetical protein